MASSTQEETSLVAPSLLPVAEQPPPKKMEDETRGEKKNEEEVTLETPEKTAHESPRVMPAPDGWTKKIAPPPKKTGTPKLRDVSFVAPTGEELKTRRQLELYLKSHPGGPSISEFDWSSGGETPRRSTRLSSRPKTESPEVTPPTKRMKKEAVKADEKVEEKTEVAPEVEMKDESKEEELPKSTEEIGEAVEKTEVGSTEKPIEEESKEDPKHQTQESPLKEAKLSEVHPNGDGKPIEEGINSSMEKPTNGEEAGGEQELKVASNNACSSEKESQVSNTCSNIPLEEAQRKEHTHTEKVLSAPSETTA